MERKYLPELPELVDRLSIVTLKSIKLSNKKEYEEEARLIMHDINLLMKDAKPTDWGVVVRAIQVNMLANETIWANETLARQGGEKQNHLLPFTHSVNGVRMRAGNALVAQMNGKKDLNLDRVNDKVCEERGYDFGGLFE